MRRLCVLSVLLGLLHVYGFAAPAPKRKPKDTGPMVIDYSPLVGCSDFSVFLTVHFENGTRIDNLETEVGGKVDSPERILRTLEASLSHFDVEVVGDSKLVIKGFKGKGVSKVEVKAPRLPKANQPTVRPWGGSKKSK